MSDPLRCAGCRATLHPYDARKYDGYCLGCANAGVPELRAEVAALRAQVAGHAERLAAALAALDERWQRAVGQPLDQAEEEAASLTPPGPTP